VVEAEQEKDGGVKGGRGPVAVGAKLSMALVVVAVGVRSGSAWCHRNKAVLRLTRQLLRKERHVEFFSDRPERQVEGR
jgi:hypothetical protein